jgi:hypothetical protein
MRRIDISLEGVNLFYYMYALPAYVGVYLAARAAVRRAGQQIDGGEGGGARFEAGCRRVVVWIVAVSVVAAAFYRLPFTGLRGVPVSTVLVNLAPAAAYAAAAVYLSHRTELPFTVAVEATLAGLYPLTVLYPFYALAKIALGHETRVYPEPILLYGLVPVAALATAYAVRRVVRAGSAAQTSLGRALLYLGITLIALAAFAALGLVAGYLYVPMYGESIAIEPQSYWDHCEWFSGKPVKIKLSVREGGPVSLGVIDEMSLERLKIEGENPYRYATPLAENVTRIEMTWTPPPSPPRTCFILYNSNPVNTTVSFAMKKSLATTRTIAATGIAGAALAALGALILFFVRWRVAQART